MKFIEAVARMEGFYVQGSRPQRNRNPGDLEFRPWMTQFEGVLETPLAGHLARFACFPTSERGFAALKHLFGFPIYKGKCVGAALATFAPPVENSTSSYVQNVCKWVPCEPTDIIDDLL